MSQQTSPPPVPTTTPAFGCAAATAGRPLSVRGSPRPALESRGSLLSNGDLENADGWQFANWGTKQQQAQCRLTFEPSARPERGRYACITRGHAEAAAQLLSEWMALEPYTQYRYGGWVRAEITEGSLGLRIFLRADDDKAVPWGKVLSNGSLYNRYIRVPTAQREWKRFVETVTVGGTPRRVQLWCQVPKAKGRAWFDDLFVGKVRKVGPPVATSRNLALNCSFEIAALPGWPDHWFGSLNAGPMIGAAGARWMQVADHSPPHRA